MTWRCGSVLSTSTRSLLQPRSVGVPPCITARSHASRCHDTRRLLHTTPAARSDTATARTSASAARPAEHDGESVGAKSADGALPSERDSRRSVLSKRLSARMESLQHGLMTAGARLNDLTGYTGIEALKRSIDVQEAQCGTLLDAVRRGRRDYEAAVARRSDGQREVNDLLQRRASWRGEDVERFTALFKESHALESGEALAKDTLAAKESELDKARTGLINLILARYHEEQIWSDKIRRASTWGTWGLVGFNVVLFVVVQLGLEPWKRRRLVGSFEDKVRQVVLEEQAMQRAAVADAGEATHVVETAAEASLAAEAVLDVAAIDTVDNELGAGVLQSTSGPDSEQSRVADLQLAVEDESMSWRDLPQAGTSAALSFATRRMLHTLRVAAATCERHGRRMADEVTSTTRWLLSERTCGLRMEDVTASCFASGVLGVLLGLMLAPAFTVR